MPEGGGKAMAIYLRLLAEPAEEKIQELDQVQSLPILVPLGFDPELKRGAGDPTDGR
jgi:hypothetical protein